MPAYNKNSDIDHSAVIEAAAESILITTSNLDYPGPSIVYVNPAFERMTGWSRRELFGKSPRIFQGPKTDLQVFSDLREKLSSNQTWEGQAINYRKDGSEFWMEWSISRLNDTQGKAYQYVAIQRDVSARIEADRRLYKALDAKRAAEQARANLARYFSPKLAEQQRGSKIGFYFFNVHKILLYYKTVIVNTANASIHKGGQSRSQF